MSIYRRKDRVLREHLGARKTFEFDLDVRLGTDEWVRVTFRIIFKML